MLELQSIMSHPVVTIEMDDPLRLVKKLFDETDFHHVIVMRGQDVAGILSDRHLLNALSPTVGTIAETREDLELLNRKAHQIMSRRVVTLTVNASVADAAQAILENRVSCIPVVHENGKLAGIVTWRDILGTLVETGSENQDAPANAA